MIKSLIGHELQRERLRALLLTDQLPSAIVLSGQAGIGKLLVARELARSLVCHELQRTLAGKELSSARALYGGCGKCQPCHLFDSNSYPDLHLVNCLEREESNVAKVRELLQTLNLRSFSGGSRIVIFNDAEHLSVQVCNALLKSIEEPRPGMFFILVTANHSRLPATVISRCQMWHFDRLSDQQVKTLLRQYGTSQDPRWGILKGLALDEIALLADGALDNINNILLDIEHWENVKRNLDALESGTYSVALQFLRESAKDKSTLRGKLHQLRLYSRNKMVQATSAVSQKRWSTLLSNFITADYLIFERNLGAAYVLNAAVLDLLESNQPNSFTLHSNSVSLIDKMVVR